MSDHTTRRSPEVKIEHGYCQCGCGQLAPIAKYSHKQRGMVKGEPIRFIHGHNAYKTLPGLAPWVAIYGLIAPYGECQCGCGNKVNFASRTCVRTGLQQGKPVRFFAGHCMHKLTLADAFWQHVAAGEPDACWEWNSHDSSTGYGKLGYRGRQLAAHRVSYELHFGPISDGMLVCHKCDNRPCVNPAHLFLGTIADNNADRDAKGRRGLSPFATSGSPRSPKLTSAQAAQIRELFRPNIIGLREEIAARFGISGQAVWMIGTGRSWRNLDALAAVDQVLARIEHKGTEGPKP